MKVIWATSTYKRFEVKRVSTEGSMLAYYVNRFSCLDFSFC